MAALMSRHAAASAISHSVGPRHIPSAALLVRPIPSAQCCPRGGAFKRARLALLLPPPQAAAPGAPQLPAPSAASTPTAAERAVAGADALLAESDDLVLPSRPRQPPLARDRLRALRAESEGLAKSKRLTRVQVGAKGLNAAVVASAAGALAGAPSGLVRVRLGDGCGLERRAAAVAMERLLDAVCVKQVGFCITLYRDKALARPDNVPAALGVGGGGGGGAAAAAAAGAAAAAAAAAGAAEEDGDEEDGDAEATPVALRRKTSSKEGGKKALGGDGDGPGEGGGGGGGKRKKSKPPPSRPAFTVV